MRWFKRKQKVPNRAAQHLEKGQLLAAEGKREEAIASLEASLAVNPDLREARLELGNQLMDLNRTEEALLHFHHLIKLNPEDAEPFFLLGESYWRSVKRESAIAQYRQALLRAPDHENARSRLREATAEQVAFSLENSNSRRDHQAWALAEYKQMKEAVRRKRSLGERFKRLFRKS